jgi:hypothetical protein
VPEKPSKEALGIALPNGYKEKKQNFYKLLSELAVAKGDLETYDEYNQLSTDAAEEEMNTTL